MRIARWIGAIGLLVLVSSSSLTAQEPQLVLDGQTSDAAWAIHVEHNSGVLTTPAQEVEIELFNISAGISGYEIDLEFLGRTSNNFYYLQVFVNRSGDAFWVYFYDYKSGSPHWKLFEGHYSYHGASPSPSALTNYRPQGQIPNYAGPDFRIVSSATELTPEGGRVEHGNLELKLYPVAHVPVTENWHEFWTLGVDTNSGSAYLLLYYTISDITVVIDLSNGQTSRLPLGIGEITGDHVNVHHNTEL